MTSDPIALATQATEQTVSFGLVRRTPKPEIRRIGISQDGEWYLYSTDPKDKDRTPVEAVATPRILDLSVAIRAKTSKYGPRQYLDVTMLGEQPHIRYVLSLPVFNVRQDTGERRNTWTVRSLLSALRRLDLQTTPLKLEPSRGDEATFINVYLDPEGLNRVDAGDIGPSEEDFLTALDECRASLGLPPFRTKLQSAAVVQPELVAP